MIESRDWLSCHGEMWHEAVDQAASMLLRDYRMKWPNDLFINLYRLADTLITRITVVSASNEDARLMPVEGGFRILLSESLHPARFRFSVAHELAHTLFYNKTKRLPQQLQNPSKREELFCSDVARRILAPKWLIDEHRLSEMQNGKDVFAKLTDKTGPFRLSKPLAARVMLADYQLARGVGGQWVKRNGTWELQRGMAYATVDLRDPQRKLLRAMAQFWLRHRREPPGFQVIGIEDVVGESAFVIVFA